MVISQVNDEPLIRFQKAVLGLGRIYGPLPRKVGKPIYEWRSYKFETSQAIICLLWNSLCSIKQKQALDKLKIAISFFKPKI